MLKTSLRKNRGGNDLKEFQNVVWDFYTKNGRQHLPWRKTRDPYKILVSEVMLQQTQVNRVIPKYKEFLRKFPTTRALAKAKTVDVLKEWQGLGYNHRALNLKRAAETIVTKYRGVFPIFYNELLKLPGVGPATAGDILAFAYNKPAVIVETNIRTVFIHHFFKNKENVSDKELKILIEKTLDKKESPRDWYYALMDYGSYLKKTLGNNTHQSKHYKKQSPFKGSNRELRSNILKQILNGAKSEAEILTLLHTPAPLIKKNLLALEKEGLIEYSKGKFRT